MVVKRTSVELIPRDRSGMVRYSDSRGSHDFSYELGAGTALVLINVPDPSKWATNTPWPVTDRALILRAIAMELIHQLRLDASFLLHAAGCDIVVKRAMDPQRPRALGSDEYELYAPGDRHVAKRIAHITSERLRRVALSQDCWSTLFLMRVMAAFGNSRILRVSCMPAARPSSRWSMRQKQHVCIPSGLSNVAFHQSDTLK
jgi:hypothetical protein